MVGVVYELPVLNNEPPVLAAYQLMLPDDAVAFSATVPGPQVAPGVVLLTVGRLLTVANTLDLAEAQPAPETASA